MANKPERIPIMAVKSSNLAGIGYNPKKQILAVEFNSGAIFHYAGVGPEIVQQLLAAESRGAFYCQQIKGKFQGQRMTGACLNCGAAGFIGETCADCGTAEYEAEPGREIVNG